MLRVGRGLESLHLFAAYAKLFPDAPDTANTNPDTMLRQIAL
jgi:hypothetical protein